MEFCQGRPHFYRITCMFLTLPQNTLQQPDERQLARGLESTDVPAHLQSMVNTLVTESARIEEGYAFLPCNGLSLMNAHIVLQVAALNTS